MKRILALILLMTLLLSACGAPADGETEATGGSTPVETDATEASDAADAALSTDDMAYMKVMVYNIYYQDIDARAANVTNLLNQVDADVLLLQEVSVGWIPYLQEFMADYGYSYYAYGRYGAEFSDETMDSGDAFTPILWKTDKYDLVESGHFWLSSTPDVVRSARWIDGTVSNFPRCNCWVILRDKETSREILLTAVHLDAYNTTVKYYSTDLIIQKMTELRGDRPAIAGGDWNLPIDDPAYGLIANSDYPDMRHQAEQTTDEGTWNAFGANPDDDLGYGDHVFLSTNTVAKVYDVLIEESKIDGVAISDHYPIVVEFYY